MLAETSFSQLPTEKPCACLGNTVGDGRAAPASRPVGRDEDATLAIHRDVGVGVGTGRHRRVGQDQDAGGEQGGISTQRRWSIGRSRVVADQYLSRGRGRVGHEGGLRLRIVGDVAEAHIGLADRHVG